MPTLVLTEAGPPIRLEDGRYLLLSTPTPLRESVLAAAAAQLAAVITDTPVERARRGMPSIEEFPRLFLHGGGATPDNTQSPGETFWSFDFTVTGYFKGATDLEAEQAGSELHARVLVALENASLGPASIEPTAGTAEIVLYSTDDSSAPAGQFVIPFRALAIAPTSYPYAP